MDFSRRVIPIVALLPIAILMIAIGCESSSSLEAESRPEPQPPTPEEQFENIVDVLRQKIEDPAIRGGSAESNFGNNPGTPVTDWSTTVSHKLLSTEEGKPRRAVITISTKSRITVVLPLGNPDDRGQGTLKKIGGDQPAIEGISLDALRTPAIGGTSIGGSSIKTLPDEQQTRLGFEHREGMWVLVTPIDDEEESFTASAVKYALKRQ